MTMPFRNIALLGATGNLGSKILKALSDGGFTVTAVQRKDSTNIAAGAAFSLKVDLLSDKELASAFSGIDVVVSAVPNPQFDVEKIMIDAAISAGVKRIVPSEFSSNLETEAAKTLPIVAEKIKIRRYMEEAAAASKIEWTSVNNGPFFVPYLWMNGIAGPNTESKTTTYHDGGDRVVCTSTPERIAEGVAKALCAKHAFETKNKAVYIYSAVVSEKKLTQMASKITGIQFAEQHRSLEQAMKTGYEGLKEGDQYKMRSFYIPFMFEERFACDFRNAAWNEKLGLNTMNDADIERVMREWLKKVEV
ncbi:nadp-binding [Trichoderma arundinaceum]|uniref:Nadp-binding n=1 Tax=Trichoderma arundinaceum TaxID=490622 RepID=A0A395NWY2_TRIAR|nr:nadp-binding [Trichoderma arundinaceum]